MEPRSSSRSHRLPQQQPLAHGPVFAMVDLLQEPACLLRSDGRLVLANKSFKRHFGLLDMDLEAGSPAELIGCTRRQFQHLVKVAFESTALTPVPLKLPNWLGKAPLRLEAARLPGTDQEGRSLAFLRMRSEVELVERCVKLSRHLQVAREQERALEHEARTLREVVTELETSAFTDALTELPNRAAFDQRLKLVVQDGFRQRVALSLVLIDLDNFKHVNDTWGHPTGDECLRRVAQAIAPLARRPLDLVARLGGEEFAILLPDCDYADGLHRAAAIRKAVAAAAIPHPTSAEGVVTASVGVVSCVPTPKLQGAWYYEQADRALYEAKRRGKNRVHASRTGQNLGTQE